TSLVILAQVLPNILFGLVAGAVADRVASRRRLLVQTNATAATFMGIAAVAAFPAAWSVPVVLLAYFCAQVAVVYAYPAAAAAVPPLWGENGWYALRAYSRAPRSPFPSRCPLLPRPAFHGSGHAPCSPPTRS